MNIKIDNKLRCTLIMTVLFKVDSVLFSKFYETSVLNLLLNINCIICISIVLVGSEFDTSPATRGE
jgi:hypothetical protein